MREERKGNNTMDKVMAMDKVMEHGQGDGDGDDYAYGGLTPFWVQGTTDGRRVERLRRFISDVFFSSGLVVFLLLVTAVIFLVFVVRSFICFTAQIFKPNGIKKSWDTLNHVLLVLVVSVLFGFVSRDKNNEDNYDESQKTSNPSTPNKCPKSNLSNPSHFETKLEHKNPILARNSNLYPDPNDFSTTLSSSGDYYQRRYCDDDIHIDSGRARNPDPSPAKHRSLEGVEHLRTSDRLLGRSKEGGDFPAPETATAVSLPEIEEKETENQEFKYETERMGRKKERSSSRKRNKELEPKDPPPRSQPPQADPFPPSPPRQKSTHRKSGGATGSPANDILNSLYHEKKKKERQKSVDIFHEAQATLNFQFPEPSHPRPPPPAVAREPELSSQTAPITITRKPPKPIKMTIFDGLEGSSISDGDSPLNSIPTPPPPLPPSFFKGPAWKFVLQGDYVRVNSSSSLSSWSGGPSDNDDWDSDVMFDAEDTASFDPSPLFYSSPNVDKKAESFITNFRAKLRLEKNNSMKKKDVGLPGVSPDSGPSQFSRFWPRSDSGPSQFTRFWPRSDPGLPMSFLESHLNVFLDDWK
ncbi:hypothetical protein CASFOL_025010 [Castilleja foliolosa]|uniref:Hydroxyproline-rich glycoprotein family protein n=1 Tax=Castilleja foliolosa TaxID=1961234 RepID=A0ABD3CRS8_9LAMI